MGKKLPEGLTFRDLQVFSKCEQQNKTLDEAAAEMGVSRDTIKRTKKRGSYRDLTLSAMEELGYTVDEYVKKLVGLTNAKKLLNCGGHDMEVEDNVVQLKAIEKIGKVYGDNAPTNIDITGSLAGSSDENILEEIESALENPVGGDSGEQGVGEDVGGQVEGEVL
jgi:hypothetical protein